MNKEKLEKILCEIRKILQIKEESDSSSKLKNDNSPSFQPQEDPFKLLSIKIIRELEDQKIDCRKVEEITAKVFNKHVLKIGMIANILTKEEVVKKNKKEYSKDERLRIEKLLNWRKRPSNKLYYRQKRETLIRDSAWMTELLTKLAIKLDPYFPHRGQGIHNSAAIKHSTVQFIANFLNDLTSEETFDPKGIRARINKNIL